MVWFQNPWIVVFLAAPLIVIHAVLARAAVDPVFVGRQQLGGVDALLRSVDQGQLSLFPGFHSRVWVRLLHKTKLATLAPSLVRSPLGNKLGSAYFWGFHLLPTIVQVL